MKRSIRLAVAAALAGASSLAFAGLPASSAAMEQCDAAASGASMKGYAIAGEKSRADRRAAMEELHGWLLREAALDAKATGISAPLTRQDRFRLGLEACDDCGPRQAEERRYQVGVGKPVGLEIDFSRASPKALRAGGRFAEGATRGAADGGFAWTAKFSSPGASGLRLGISGLDLPGNAALYVFNERGEAFGPYVGKGANGSGELVTNMLSGDTAYLQLRVTGAPVELDRLKLRIDDVGHISSKFELARDLDNYLSDEKTHCTSGTPNASCVENAECYGTGALSSINNLRNAIGAMLYRSGGGYYICTGGLIANEANNPLFLTANHCISKGSEASSLEVYWDHTASCGTRSCSAAWEAQGGRASDVGASIVASNRTGDYTLMQLSYALPSGTYALGWNSTPVANSNGTQLHRISHPNGAPQAYSEQQVDTGAGVCGTLPRGSYIYSTDNLGATEGGSSGSPVVNSAGEIVGQLYGACGTNLNDVCDSGSNATVDGAFAGYFSAVESHLTSGGGEDPPPTGYALEVSGSKVKGRWVSNLVWSGTTASQVDVFRNGSKVATVSNSGNYDDNTGLRGSATLTYRVCNAGTTTCSNEASVTF